MSLEVAPVIPLRDSRDGRRADAVFPSYVSAPTSGPPVRPDGAHLTFGEACIAIRASPTTLRWGDKAAPPHPVPHVLSVCAEPEVAHVDTSMTSGSAIARVEHIEGSGIAVGENPHGPSGQHVYPPQASTDDETPFLCPQKKAFIGCGLRSFHKFGGTLGPRVAIARCAPIGIRTAAKSPPLATCLAPEGASMTRRGAGLSARKNDAAGCTLGHVGPLSRVRPRPGVVSATAGAFSYERIQGIDLPLNRDRGVN